jgi:hypothetical protein
MRCAELAGSTCLELGSGVPPADWCAGGGWRRVVSVPEGSAKWKVESAECKVRSAECGVSVLESSVVAWVSCNSWLCPTVPVLCTLCSFVAIRMNLHSRGSASPRRTDTSFSASKPENARRSSGGIGRRSEVARGQLPRKRNGWSKTAGRVRMRRREFLRTTGIGAGCVVMEGAGMAVALGDGKRRRESRPACCCGALHLLGST